MKKVLLAMAMIILTSVTFATPEKETKNKTAESTIDILKSKVWVLVIDGIKPSESSGGTAYISETLYLKFSDSDIKQYSVLKYDFTEKTDNTFDLSEFYLIDSLEEIKEFTADFKKRMPKIKKYRTNGLDYDKIGKSKNGKYIVYIDKMFGDSYEDICLLEIVSNSDSSLVLKSLDPFHRSCMGVIKPNMFVDPEQEMNFKATPKDSFPKIKEIPFDKNPDHFKNGVMRVG